MYILCLFLPCCDLYPIYLKATQPPSNLKTHQVSIKFARLACQHLSYSGHSFVYFGYCFSFPLSLPYIITISLSPPLIRAWFGVAFIRNVCRFNKYDKICIQKAWNALTLQLPQGWAICWGCCKQGHLHWVDLPVRHSPRKWEGCGTSCRRGKLGPFQIKM